MNRNRNRMARSFEEEAEQETPAAAELGETMQPDYTFEGFSVEFLDKVALLPALPAAKPPPQGRR